jgi:hypothetical protein
VRVYEWNETSWTQRGTDIDGADADYAGSSVSLSSDGGFIAIGSPGYPLDDWDGMVRVFSYVP